MVSSISMLLAVAFVAFAGTRTVSARSLVTSTTPEQVHLALGEDPATSMTVSWITPDQAESVVAYAVMSSSSYNYENGSAGEQYQFKSMYRKDTYTSGYIHHVTLTGLQPETTYKYKCGQSESFSPEYNFTTPAAVSPDNAIRIGVMGDMGQTANSTKTRDHIIAGNYSHVMLVGDLSYADSAWKPGHYGPCDPNRWDTWGRLVEPLTNNKALMTLPGNHEVEQDGPPPATQTQFLAYNKRMAMPSKHSGGNQSLYYSYEVASAHFIMLNSYMDFNKSSPQYNFLVADLAKVDRSKTPWLIVSMHAPWYNSNLKHHNEIEETGMRATMEPLLVAANVDLVLAGHVHAYERMYPVAFNKTNPKAPTYINIGDAGNREGPCPDYYPQPSWSAFRESRFGHGELHIHNSTHMKWSWHRIIDDETKEADSVYIVRGADGHADVQGPNEQYDGYRHLKTATM